MIGIYKITNLVNKKIYIGQSVNIQNRLTQHKNFKDKDSLIDIAIASEGKENFKYEIIEECLISELDDKEKHYIQFYDCMCPNGYNRTCGGSGGYTREQIEFSQAIIRDLLDSQLTYYEIQKKYDISIQSLGAINNGRTYHDDDLSYPLRKVSSICNKRDRVCIDCGLPISKSAVRCIQCANKAQYKATRPEKDVLAKEIAEYGFEAVGRKYGVSGNAIKKWCSAYGLPRLKQDIKKYIMDK